MLDAHEFGDAVAMLYEAAAVPEVWPDAIARLARIAGCTGGLLFSHSALGTNWVTCREFAPVFARFMEQGWMERNARMAGLLAHGGTGFVTDHDLFTDQELAHIPLYTEFMRPEGYGWGTATHVRASSGENIVFTLERKLELGPVSRREVAVLDGIRPHLARAAVLASKLQMQRAQASLASFEHAGSPAALIDARGSVSATNPSFETLFGQIVIRARDRIALDDERAHLLLQKALSELAQDRLGDTRSIPVPRKDDNLGLHRPCAADPPAGIGHLLAGAGHAGRLDRGSQPARRGFAPVRALRPDARRGGHRQRHARRAHGRGAGGGAGRRPRDRPQPDQEGAGQDGLPLSG
ncbi:hypothetical protein [Bosea sp. (in: a-proteobacteria)]